MKKLLSIVLSTVLALSVLAACGSTENANTDSDAAVTEETAAVEETAEAAEDTAAASDVKIGVVLVGDENEGYTYAHIAGIKAAADAVGIPQDNIIWKYSIPEDETCYTSCVDLVDQGCVAIFSNSYGHQSFTQQAAAEYPDVQFVAMTGDTAARSGLDNFSNAFTKVYESRFVSGVVAGLKVKELVESGALADNNFDADGNVKIGYVGAFPYAEVVSGYTAFFLGIKSVYEQVSMEVTYTNSWFSIAAEGAAADALMADGCVIIGQHADSTGAPTAVEAALTSGKVAYSVGYNVDMTNVAPTAALTSATNNWEVYYEVAFKAVVAGEKIPTNWAEGYDQAAVGITVLGQSVAEGTADKVAEVEAAIKDGSLHVFDTERFTVGGAHLDSYLVDMNGDFVNDDEEAIWDGFFHESELRSAPSFDIRIDGITELN
ncbi:MAG: BMP family ABC transporter substrate-binding protein [Lachnospiraceae bacterium]|nr:BMP family ABC transporter substrate-binding protein [Lachnospiraceae bacterium]